MPVPVIQRLRNFIRANFFAGVFIAIPFTATIIFMIWLWSKINGPLSKIFDIAGSPEEAPWSAIYIAVEESQYHKLVAPIVGLIILVLAVLVLGIITRSIVGRTLLAGIENVVARVPLVGMLYMSLKQLGEAFLSSDGTSKFQKAVAVQFPYKGCWAIGFVTGTAQPIMRDTALSTERPNAKVLTIFVPCTPLPTAGFLMMVPEEETLPLDMSVQDALKLVVSGGMVGPSESQRRAPGNLTQIINREINQVGMTSSPRSSATET